MLHLSDGRHGEAAHYVRPDRVYRTGVVVATSGFQPNQDVQAIAQAFTDRPLSLPLSGPGGGWWERTKEKMRSMFGPRPQMMAPMAPMAPQVPMQANFTRYGAAYAQVGQQVAPAAYSKQVLLAHLMQGGIPGGVPAPVAEAQIDTTMNKFWNMRWNG
jgi:hypothetical protein